MDGVTGGAGTASARNAARARARGRIGRLLANYVNALSSKDMEPNRLRRSVLGAIRSAPPHQTPPFAMPIPPCGGGCPQVYNACKIFAPTAENHGWSVRVGRVRQRAYKPPDSPATSPD